jgi:hypothetical protein
VQLHQVLFWDDICQSDQGGESPGRQRPIGPSVEQSGWPWYSYEGSDTRASGDLPECSGSTPGLRQPVTWLAGRSREPARGSREAPSGSHSTGIGHPGRCRALDLVRRFLRGLACWLAASVILTTPALAESPLAPQGPADDQAKPPADRRNPSYSVILNAPADLNTLLQRIQQPDLEVRPVDRSKPGADAAGPAVAAAAWVVESVRIKGRVRGESAALTVELGIITAADDPTWVPIRLDGQRLIDAREGSRILDLRMEGGVRWLVELVGRGLHRIMVDLRCPLTTKPARASLSLAIPEAPSTSLELDFDHREPDLIVGLNEVYGQAALPDGQGSRLSARLSPRSRVDVSWAVDAEAGGRNPPLLTAQGDIAIDIDSEQMRTRSSWVIRCVRGVTRTLQVQVDEQDEVTDVRLDDQEVEAESGGEGDAGQRTILLPEPLRPGAEKRLVMKTRRSYDRGMGHRITFGGFPILHAREQSGAIGVTQSANLWVAPTSSQGLRRIVPTFLPKELAERPGTSLAFEFLDQPFTLNLDVEASPPLIRSRSRTLFRLEADRARSEATIELQWVRGRPFEIQLRLGPGLEVVSVGPASVVEAWNLTGRTAVGSTTAGSGEPRGLTIRLAPPVRDQNKVTLNLEGFQRLPREGPVKLAVFAPDDATAVSSSFAIAGDTSLSVELDEEAIRSDRATGVAFRVQDGAVDRLTTSSGGEPGRLALSVDSLGSPQVLPIRLARHARSLRQETVLSADLSRRSIDLVQKTSFTVRHGTLASLLVRVPPALAGLWQLDREVVDREELDRAADGSRQFRLQFDRPILDRATLSFRYRLPINPALDASSGREIEIPWISFPEADLSPARIELNPAPGVIYRGGDPSWTRAGGQAESGGESTRMSFVEASAGQCRSFRFQAQVLALEPATLPELLIPRSLIESSLGLDDVIQFRTWYWVERHGPVFPFALPEGARLVAARVGGRPADRVDFESKRAAYRIRLPAESAGHPVLVELEYTLDAAAAASRWEAPRLLEGGLILQTLWEARLPWDRTLLGVPRGWSDENEWYWGGKLWIRRPVRDGAVLSDWLLGDGAPAAAVTGLRESNRDESQHLLFSRSVSGPAEPLEMKVWIVSRAWLVAACSGVTLLVGFLALFSRLRFRTVWAIAAVLSLLAASMLQPSLAAQIGQSALMGAALTCLGVLIQHQLDRRRSPSQPPAREPSSGVGQPRADASPAREPGVGSDDSTAIRVRTPSTMDFVPTALTGQTVEEAPEHT